MWAVYAAFSAVFAAVTSILAKVGIRDVGSHLATAIRTMVVLIMAWGMVFITGQQKDMARLSQGSNLTFLILSGIATGLSWLCYFRALQLGDVSRVAPIDKMSVTLTILMSFLFLHESVSLKALIGMALITAGTLIMVL